MTCAIIAIVGGSASGKTTLADSLAAELSGAPVLREDAYYRCSSTVQDFDPNTFNFDAPDAKEHALLGAHLASLRAGEAVEAPTYCFATHRREARTDLIAPGRHVILEGLHVLVRADMRALVDFAVFVDTPADVRLARRLLRDVTERARDPASVVRQYLANVRPMHEEHVAPQMALADLVVDGAAPTHHSVATVLAALKRRDLGA